jgi:hypothetical protein
LFGFALDSHLHFSGRVFFKITFMKTPNFSRREFVKHSALAAAAMRRPAMLAVLNPIDEVAWVSTNGSVAAIQCLALAGEQMPG